MKLRLRNNALFFFSLLTFFVVLAMLVITFDRQYFQRAKKQMIEEKYFEFFPIENESLQKLVERFLTIAPDDAATRATVQQEIISQMDQFFANYPDAPIIAIEVAREGNRIIRRERPDGHHFNTLKNSLILRDFKAYIQRKFRHKDPPFSVMGDLIFTYTTPPNFEPVEKLTQRYWAYLIVLVGAFTAGYILVLRYLVLPIKKVTEAIQGSQGRAARFIMKPRSKLEKLYNLMARDALLSAITIGLRNPRNRQLRMNLADLFEFLVPRITEWFGFTQVWLFDLVWEGPAKVVPVRQVPSAGDGPAAWHSIADSFDPSLVRNLQTSWESKALELFSTRLKNGPGHLFTGVIPTNEQDGQMRVLAMVIATPLEGSFLSWYQTTADNIYRQVIGLVERQIGQSRELFREKSEANITLSRNLGHDLTNIIATNKLELMTVGHILHGDPQTWFDTKEKAEIMKESLTRLLDNTRSLQQIVNLYRAYEYLKSPRYEPTNANKVIEELIGIFRLSMSAPVDISCDFSPDLPEVEIEPRLVKLALFNLLSNAQDSIRRLPLEEQNSARIVVHTSLQQKNGDAVCVRISDTGSGIRTPDGKLATSEQIERIFDLGYTTKANGDGEGLGLNWVRTILTEFHGGELTAYNRPEGGATIQFTLPVSKENRSTAAL